MAASCGGGSTKKTADKHDNDTIIISKDSIITVAVMPTLDCLPLFVMSNSTQANDPSTEGRQQGTGGKYLRLLLRYALTDCDTTLLRGSAEAALTDYVHADFLHAKQDSVVRLPHSNYTLHIITNRKARISSAAQLTDKMVMGDRQGADMLVAQHLLDSAKLSQEKAFVVGMRDIRIRYNMLQNNETDALVLPQPYADMAMSNGDKSILTCSQFNGRQLGTLTWIGRFRNSKKQTVIRPSDNLRQIVRWYNQGVDSLNRYGLHRYDSLLTNRMGFLQKDIKKIKEHKYRKISL